jgi:hypothetical protein
VALARCAELEARLPVVGGGGAAGLAAEPVFRYREICWRGTGRYDVQVDRACEPWRGLLAGAGGPGPAGFLAPLLERALGADYKLLFLGVVVARPGAEDQGLHADGGHLFRAPREAGGAAADGYAPPLACHCLNVFLPLVDLTPELGPTEFYPGSHALAAVMPGGYPEVATGRKGIFIFIYIPPLCFVWRITQDIYRGAWE